MTKNALARLWGITDEQLKEVTDRMAEEYRAKRQRQAEFVASDTFALMLAAFKSRGPVSLCEEDFRYFPDREKASLGWTTISDDEVSMFITVVSDIDGVDDQQHDDECPFPNVSFIKYGLHVFVMSGQGTHVSISYPPPENVQQVVPKGQHEIS